MKKNILIALWVLLCLASCNRSGLDPEEGSDNPTEESVFWDVVGQLVAYGDITPDYKGKTFKAHIGTPDGGDESVRVVAVNDLGAAVARYNTLTGASITETTPSHTYSNKEVGTLTWNLSGDNTSWATVDVNVPAVPGLRKIIYRSAEQGDVNGSVGDDGSAYYRFGDVIQRQTTTGTEYWICVRPSFGPEGKGKSHWVSVSPLPQSNLWPYYNTGEPFVPSNDMQYGLPYNLGKATEWHQDLAELLFAIMYPHDWFTNATNYYHVSRLGFIDGLRIFNDFQVGNIGYHNEAFWNLVQVQWKNRDLVRKIFGISYEQMEQALNPHVQDPAGIHFLYYGHEWLTRVSNTAKLFDAHYTHGADNTQKNMHKETKKTVSAQVVVTDNKTEGNNNFSFNFYILQTQAKPYIEEPRFFGDNAPRWTVRYMTGEELSSSGNYDPQQPIPGFSQVDGETYRYYRDVMKNKNLTDPPEVTVAENNIENDKEKQNLTSFDGIGHYGFGDVLTDQSGFHWFVVRISGGSQEQNPLTEKSPYAELVSFEGVVPSASKLVANTIATRDKIIRVSMPLWHLFKEAYGNSESVNSNGYKVKENVKAHAGVDLTHIMQEVSIERYGEANAKGGTELCSLGYFEEGSANQHLIRYITERGVGNSMITVLYDKYPSVNTYTNIYPELTSAQFNGDPIYLQDVTDQAKVDAHARDYMAEAPFFGTQERRQIRTTTDDRAKDINNYLYYRNIWDLKAQPLGMWNEPVLLLRATAIYDRGEYEGYATMTIDGHELTMKSRGLPNHTENMDNPYAWLHAAMIYQRAQDRYVNGTHQAEPSWQSVWGTN